MYFLQLLVLTTWSLMAIINPVVSGNSLPAFSHAFDAVLSTIGLSRSQACLPMQSSALPRCYFFLYHSRVLIVIFVITVIIILLRRRHHNNHHHQTHCNFGILVTLNFHALSLHMHFKAVPQH